MRDLISSLRDGPPLLPLGWLLVVMVAILGCGPEEPPVPPDVYEVRGLVRQLPSPRSPGSSLQIRHESIPNFRDSEGEVVGMDTMTMPFAVSDDALLEGINVGDKVVATLEVRWRGKDPLRVSALETLPPETVLEFEEPVEASQPSEETHEAEETDETEETDTADGPE